MTEWFTQLDKSLWLRKADTGPAEAAFVRRALHLRRGQKVLDCPCGDGRIAVPLARAGIRVIGVDRVARFAARARTRLRRNRPPGDTLCMDMRRIDFDGEFHAAFNYWGSFGYFTDAENLDFLARLARALRPGGRLLIDQANRQFILRHFARKMTHGPVTTYPRWAPRSQRLEAVWVIRRRGRKVRCFSSMRAYTLGQFRAMFARVGLELEAAYGGPDGDPYRPSSRRLIVVGRKAATSPVLRRVAACRSS